MLFFKPNVEKLYIKRNIKGLTQALTYKKNWLVRKDAASALGSIGDKSAVEPLIQALEDDDENVRFSVAEALGRIKEPQAVEPLIKVLGDNKKHVRAAAAWALGVLRDPRAVEPLISALGDNEGGIRKAAATALGELKDPRVVEPLIRALGDNEWTVRRAAVEALDKVKELRVIEFLIKMLGDANGDVRIAAAKALEGIEKSQWHSISGCVDNFKRLDGSKDPNAEELSQIIKSLEMNSFLHDRAAWAYGNVRKDAIRSSLQIIDSRVVEPLIRALGDNERLVRKAAAKILSNIGEPQWMQIIHGDDADFIRLGESKDPRVVEPLIKALGDNKGYARAAAAWALGELKDPRAVEPLIRALGDSKGDVRKAAAEALGRIKDPLAVEPLIKVLGDNNWYVRVAAACALGELKDPRAVEPLIRALGDDNLLVRKAAAWALGEIKDPCAVEPLIRRLRDTDEVRCAAAKALGEIQDPRAVEPIIAMLGEYNWVKEVLAKIKSPRTMELLIKKLDAEANERIREAAAELLGNLYDPQAAKPLIRAFGDNDGGVRRASALALNKIGEPQWKHIILGDDDDYEKLGKIKDRRLVEPLLKALRNNKWAGRKAAALSLIEFGKAEESILSDEIKSLIVQPHADEFKHTGESSDCTWYHVDEGIGLKLNSFL